MGTAADTFVSCVDAPVEGSSVDARVKVKGWCFRTDGKQVAAVRVRAGRKLSPGSYGLHRPDVNAAHGGRPGEHTGFEIWVWIPSRGAQLLLEAADESGRWSEFARVGVLGAARGPLSDSLRWLRFWRRAWAGRPDALSLLSDAEQNYQLQRLHERGWTQLDRIFQHAPKPLELERFPRAHPGPSKGPKICIVTPSLNQARYLKAAAESVLSQTGVRVDYTVQDGGSKDGSIELLAQLEQQYARRSEDGLLNFSWVSEADQGQADAIQRAFAHSQGKHSDLMGWLNSDDQLMPGALRFVADYFAKHPETEVIHGHRVIIDEQGRELGRWTCPRPSCSDLSLHDFIPQETLFWRRSLWNRVGGLDTRYRFAMDWDLLLRFKESGAHIERLPWFLGLFRAHAEQKSQSWVQSVGMKEMDQLRTRTLGRAPTDKELEESFRRSVFDSALVAALLRKGLRV